jgi:hypothetical protein
VHCGRNTGKSLSEALLFAELRTWKEHVVYKNCSECQKQFLYATCSPHACSSDDSILRNLKAGLGRVRTINSDLNGATWPFEAAPEAGQAFFKFWAHFKKIKYLPRKLKFSKISIIKVLIDYIQKINSN